MIQDVLNSFKENFNQKTQNPFLGTFIIVWIIDNWKFFYSLFYFEPEIKLQTRISIIQSYFKNYGISDILQTIFFTFVTLVITYTLLSLSRLIISFFDKIVTPKIYKITDKSSIVLKTDFQKIQIELERLETKVRNERETRIKLQEENEILEKRILELLVSNSVPVQATTIPKKEEAKTKNKTQLVTEKLIKDNKAEEFKTIAGMILNSEKIEKDAYDISYLTILGLITLKGSQGGGWYFYNLTEIGKVVHDELLFNT